MNIIEKVRPQVVFVDRLLSKLFVLFFNGNDTSGGCSRRAPTNDSSHDGPVSAQRVKASPIQTLIRVCQKP